MNITKNFKIILMFFLTVCFTSTNLKAEPRPDGVTPQYDDEGNQEYYNIYGEG